MEGWAGSWVGGGEWCNWDGAGRGGGGGGSAARSYNSWKPPHPPGSGHCSVPLWEKKFCSDVGKIPWKTLCENQRFVGMYNNVLEWDDSAALEAFQNAKTRFCAEYHGFPCTIPFPDPGMYIDVIDHNAFVDPEFVADLERHPPPPANTDKFSRTGLDSSTSTDKPVQPTGWGDPEDTALLNNNDTRDVCHVNWDHYVEHPIGQIQATGWRDAADPRSCNWDSRVEGNNAWIAGAPGWGEAALQNDSWHVGRNNYNNKGRGFHSGHWDNRNYEPDRRHSRKRDGGGRSGFRSTKSKYQIGVYQPNNNWRNCTGRNRTSGEACIKGLP